MALETKLNVVQNDKGYNLNFTLNDSAGNPQSLASITSIVFNAQIAGTSTLKIAAAAMVVDSASLGQCHYVVQATDFDTPGNYYGSIVVTYASGQILTWPGIVITVQPVLPRNY